MRLTDITNLQVKLLLYPVFWFITKYCTCKTNDIPIIFSSRVDMCLSHLLVMEVLSYYGNCPKIVYLHKFKNLIWPQDNFNSVIAFV